MGETYLTRAGYEKLKTDLERLYKFKAELSKEIGEAMEQGDLKENAGYIASKERQAEVLRRITEIDSKLKSARLVETLKVKKDEARIGATVTMKEESSGEEFVYTLVSSDESDPSAGKISVESPMAQGILGSKVGKHIKIALPAGEKKFHILKVEYK